MSQCDWMGQWGGRAQLNSSNWTLLVDHFRPATRRLHLFSHLTLCHFFFTSPMHDFFCAMCVRLCGAGAKVFGYLTDLLEISIFVYVFNVDCLIFDSFNSFNMRTLQLALGQIFKIANSVCKFTFSHCLIVLFFHCFYFFAPRHFCLSSFFSFFRIELKISA